MHARSTTIQARLDALDSGLAQVQDQVMPALLGMPGCIGMSMLVNRQSGRCIATSAWQSEEEMRASEDRVGPIRSQAARMLGGEPRVEEWEIAHMHRDHTSRPGACVRTTWVRMAPSEIDRAIDVYRMGVLPALEDLGGFCSASLMVNRESGRGVSSVTYDSREALEASRERSASMARSATREVGAEILEIDEFELAIAHLRVPELA